MRILDDDTLVVFVSDCHIGGDHGRDIFESADDLTALLDDLGRRTGPVELVLAGDFFDCLRISAVPDGQTRTGVTIARPEYRSLFAALKRFAAGTGRTVTYLPGNHDAEVWWNEAIRDELKRAGLVHAFALSWAAAFKSDPLAVIYCEHGNEFDPANLKRDYRDPYDTPFGDHIVTDVIPRLPHGRAAEAMQLHDIERVFPLDTIPNWIASKLFYTLVTETVRWLLLPLTIAFVAYELISFAIGTGVRAVQTLLVDVAYDIAVVVVAASVFFFVARTIATRSMRASPPALNEADAIRDPVGERRAATACRQLPGRYRRVRLGPHARAVAGHFQSEGWPWSRRQFGLLAAATPAYAGPLPGARRLRRPVRADACARRAKCGHHWRRALGASKTGDATLEDGRAPGDRRPTAADAATWRRATDCRIGHGRAAALAQ